MVAYSPWSSSAADVRGLLILGGLPAPQDDGIPLFDALIILAHHLHHPASDVVAVECFTLHDHQPLDVDEILQAKEEELEDSG